MVGLLVLLPRVMGGARTCCSTTGSQSRPRTETCKRGGTQAHTSHLMPCSRRSRCSASQALGTGAV
jgi:hypothetical protein